MHDFSSFTDSELAAWIGQYSGHQAGYYPGLRRTRLAAEREAARRGPLPSIYAAHRWWHFTRETPKSEDRRREIIGRKPDLMAVAMAADGFDHRPAASICLMSPDTRTS